MNGPVKEITYNGNVVGSCLKKGKTNYDLFVEFLSSPTVDFPDKTGYQIVHKNVCEISPTAYGYKTEQKMIDDIGEGLGLTKDKIRQALNTQAVSIYFATNGVSCNWSYEESSLPGNNSHKHYPGEPVRENVIPTTCKKSGSYDSVVYCTVCGEEISRETVVVEKLNHTVGDPVEENFVPSTCQVSGSYDKVYYCTVCGEEISREMIVIGKLLHTPGDEVIENVVPATCMNAGRYDKNVYCTYCGEWLSSETISTGKLSHNIIFVDTVPATANRNGMMAHYECTYCGKKFSDESGNNEVSDEELAIMADHVRGDADANGEFDYFDVITLRRYLNELPVSDFDEIASDVDFDGIVDIIDVALMCRVLANMTTFERWDAMHIWASTGVVQDSKIDTDKKENPISSIGSGSIAVITIYGFNGQSETMQINVGDTFDVYTYLNASDLTDSGKIAAINASQMYTDSLLLQQAPRKLMPTTRQP